MPKPRRSTRYFIGLAAIQTAIAFAAMYWRPCLGGTGRFAMPAVIRLLGAVVAGFGLAILVQQIMLAA